MKKISSKSTGELQEKADKLEDRYVGFKNGGVAFQMEQDLLEAAAQQNVSSSKIYLKYEYLLGVMLKSVVINIITFFYFDSKRLSVFN